MNYLLETKEAVAVSIIQVIRFYGERRSIWELRNFLRKLLEWADKRFPERVVVTQAEFLDLKRVLGEVTLDKDKAEHRLRTLEDKAKKTDMEINKFNALMGVSGMRGPVGLQR